MHFYKYQATGNDFIMINGFDQPVELDSKLIQHMADRKFGIGSDGVIVLTNHPVHSFEMIFYNPDGSKSMCGNGARCAVQLAHDLKIIDKSCQFVAIDGLHTGEIREQDVRISMMDVMEIKPSKEYIFINTGSPHHIVFKENVNQVDVLSEGSKIRHHKDYLPLGTNVNFLQELESGKIFVRTYEKGVENETLSCGTGVTAASIAYGIGNDMEAVAVKTLGGNLSVDFIKRSNNHITDIYLCGPTKKVFKGEIEF